MEFVKKYSDLLVIALVWTVLFVSNFSFNSWLTGWDNLHPEFDFGLNIYRSFFGAWQEHQGLGLVAVMGHASDLPRQIFLFLLNFIFPANWLRQLYFFLMLLVGSMGVYFLSKKNICSALFYLLSLIAVQMFYVPFEAFAAHFGLLPWLLFLALQLGDRVTWKNVALFVMANILALPQAYVPTVFIIYFLAVSVVALAKKSWIILSIVLMVNAFWLLPFSYSTIGRINVPVDAKTNQMSTEKTYLENKEFGDLTDVITLRGFWLQASDFGFRESSGYIMEPWRQHLLNPVVALSGVLLFGFISVGIGVSLKKRKSDRYIFLALFLVSLVILTNATPPFSWVDDLFNKLPFFFQVFRSPFTKFSILLSLMFAVYFGLGLKYLNKKIVYIGALSALVLYALPVFQGGLFYKQEKINISIEYFQTFDYFSKQKLSTRIANFPQPTYWGWGFENWGYGGSGFLWYGISQPILDRTFDVWNRESENYYWEISRALYSKNLPLFESVLEKYRVNWMLLDENVINPSSSKALFNDEFKELIERSDKFQLEKKFGNISIYHVELARPTKDFVSIASKLPATPGYKWGNLDQAFSDFGDYEEGSEIYYQNRTLFTGKRQEDLEFNPANIVTGEPRVFDISRKCSEDSGKTTECVTIYLPDLVHAEGYVVSVESINYEGLPLAFWIENLNSRKSDLETYLPKGQHTSYFVLPPMELDGLGYALHFDSVSVGREKVVNEVGQVTVAPFDYRGMVSEKLGDAEPASYLAADNFEVAHPNPSWYQIDLKHPGENLILAQSFENGWVAWDQDFRFLKHKKINNWANGWELSDSSKTVYIFFWPQVLEFIGFGILGVFVVGLLIAQKSRKESRNN